MNVSAAVLNPRSKAENSVWSRGVPSERQNNSSNNYDKEVFNGDIGVISALDLVDHVLSVDFDGHSVEYDWSEADQLVLAYAVTVHKAQGSEFPAVVIPLVTSQYLMLQRNYSMPRSPSSYAYWSAAGRRSTSPCIITKSLSVIQLWIYA
jgi:ATP-dependent exoDNAse (exonuclease V) alpha subunit